MQILQMVLYSFLLPCSWNNNFFKRPYQSPEKYAAKTDSRENKDCSLINIKYLNSLIPFIYLLTFQS